MTDLFDSTHLKTISLYFVCVLKYEEYAEEKSQIDFPPLH